MAANNFGQLVDGWEPLIRKAFLDSIYNLRDAAQIDQIARMLEAGDVDGAIRAVGLDPISFRPFDKQLENAFEAGGNATARIIPPAIQVNGLRTVFQFAIRNPAAEQWLRNYSSNLVKEIVDDQRNTIRTALTAGLEKGANPRTSALDLVGRINRATGRREGGVIGLTNSQTEWVNNYAAELASETPTAALSRSLRDARFDAAVRKAEAKGDAIPADLQAKMVAAYKNRALRYRAETISRSETIRALHTAQNQAMDQAINSGAVKADVVTMVWRSAHDNRVRDAHRGLDGQSVKFGGVFQSELGPIRYPGDPDAVPGNVINCRCTIEPKIDFLAGIT